MITIHLHDIRVYAFHGVYGEEQLTGSEYNVSADLYFAGEENITRLEQTLNYVAALDIIQARMRQSTPLLETLAQEMVQQLKQAFPPLQRAVIQVMKLQAPVTQFTGRLGVTVDKVFD